MSAKMGRPKCSYRNIEERNRENFKSEYSRLWNDYYDKAKNIFINGNVEQMSLNNQILQVLGQSMMFCLDSVVISESEWNIVVKYLEAYKEKLLHFKECDELGKGDSTKSIQYIIDNKSTDREFWKDVIGALYNPVRESSNIIETYLLFDILRTMTRPSDINIEIYYRQFEESLSKIEI